jgi:hypothetical protein
MEYLSDCSCTQEQKSHLKEMALVSWFSVETASYIERLLSKARGKGIPLAAFAFNAYLVRRSSTAIFALAFVIWLETANHSNHLITFETAWI